MKLLIQAISLAALLHGRSLPTADCHPGTVSYKFVGAPGMTFTYSGEQFVIPASGWVELVGHGGKKVYTASSGKTLPLDVWPIDEFGTRVVQLQPRDDDGYVEPAPVSRTLTTPLQSR